MNVEKILKALALYLAANIAVMATSLTAILIHDAWSKL